MVPEGDATALRRAGWRRVAIGIAVGGVGFALAVAARPLGIGVLRPALPFVMVVGLVVYGTGVHHVLWAGRDSPGPGTRAIGSLVVALASWLLLSAAAGLIARLVQRA